MKIIVGYLVITMTLLSLFIVSSFANNKTFFLPFNMNGTRYVDIKIDKLGGKHIAYGELNGDGVFYGYCANNCELLENWSVSEVFNSSVSFGSEPSKIQLQLNPENNPRIGFEVNGYSTQSKGYYYSECDQECHDATNWHTVKFVLAGENILGESRWFKLNKHGNPRAVTIFSEDANYLEDQRVTLIYSSCDNNCLELANWTYTSIATWPDMGLTPSMYTSMELTSMDKPRIGVFALNSTIGSDGSYASLYFECNETCENYENWSWVYLQNQWVSQFDLTLDLEDRVRVAAYSDGTISYSKCDDSCLNENNWHSTSIEGLPAESGYYINLVYDKLNRPHMAYTVNSSGSQLDYLYCTNNCDSPEISNWCFSTLEYANLLEYIPFLNDDCSYQIWNLEGPVSLALDSVNNPFFGYSAANWQGWYCVDPNVSISSVLHRGRIGHMVFSTPIYTLTVLTSGDGLGTITGDGISCPGDCTEDYTEEAVVTLTAIPAGGAKFTGWSGGGCSGTETCVVTIDGHKEVTATFILDSPQTNCTFDDDGDGDVDGLDLAVYTTGGIVNISNFVDEFGKIDCFE